MWRSVAIGVAVAGLLAGCSWGNSAQQDRLNLTVRGPNAVRRLAVTCPTGDMRPADVSFICAALQDYLPRLMREHSVCSCGGGDYRVMVTGTFNGKSISSPVEVSYCGSCGLARQASRDVSVIFEVLHVPHV
jgi:hypothetical protein